MLGVSLCIADFSFTDTADFILVFASIMCSRFS